MKYISTRGDQSPRHFCDILLEGLAPEQDFMRAEQFLGLLDTQRSRAGCKRRFLVSLANADCSSSPESTRARDTASDAACSGSITPAIQAAAYSPAPYPITAAGVTPQVSQDFARAYSIAKRVAALAPGSSGIALLTPFGSGPG